MVKRAINFFATKLPREAESTILQCLMMIRFAMGHTLITFRGKYFEYGSNKDLDSKGLTIGGYESAWLADLVACFLLEKCSDAFEPWLVDCYRIYRDDGFLIMHSKRYIEDVCSWLTRFQQGVNFHAGCTALQFTATVWREGETARISPCGKVSSVSENAFPFLDMELFWRNGELAFRVHKKPNQQLKYLNLDSTHPSATSKAIPHGFCLRLANLTSQDSEIENKRIDEVYLEHVNVLRKVGLCTDELPTFGEVFTKCKDGIEERELRRHKRQKNARRQCFCCCGI